VIRSIENQTDGVGSRVTVLLMLESVAYNLDLVKTTLWESEAVAEEINQSQCSIPGIVIGRVLLFCFRLRQSKFHWIC